MFKNWGFLKSIIFFILTLSHRGLYSQSHDLKVEIDKLIRFDTEIDFKKIPGFIVAVVDNDSTYYFSYGTTSKGEKNNFSKDDIFEIGSVTKVFTSSLISVLVSEGLISYSDQVNSYLPEEYQNPRLKELTISDLITHQSGMPKRPSYFGRKEKDFQNPYEHYSVSDLLRFYRDYIPEQKAFEYSHTNYALLEIIINKVTSKSYQDALTAKIFRPLDMSNSFVDFSEKKENVTIAGYSRALKPVQPWTFSAFKASEGIKSSACDMVKFIRANMNFPSSGLESIFKHNFNPPINSSFNTQLSVATGWHLIHMNQFYIATHTGKTSGHCAFVCMVRETKTAVVILTNSSLGTEDLAMQILRMINYNWKRINI
jgi:serine-type D-Ala-D-Ala carboxypeptidase/endopeptidase